MFRHNDATECCKVLEVKMLYGSGEPDQMVSWRAIMGVSLGSLSNVARQHCLSL